MTITLRSGSATDTGKVRPTNQDCILEERGVYAVADGMGGHAGGEIAAQTAIDVVREEFANAGGEITGSLLGSSIRAANRAVWARAGAERSLRGMGTTLVGLTQVHERGGDRLHVANVGDSRAYVLKNGQLRQITTDHTVVEEKLAAHELTTEQAANHPHRHILTRALGTEPEVEVDSWQMVPVVGDRYLLCSDGLFNEASNDEITEVLRRNADPQTAADKLVGLARAHGGSDNISVVVVDVITANSEDGKHAREKAPVATSLLPETGPPESEATGQPGVDVPIAPAAAGAAVDEASATDIGNTNEIEEEEQSGSGSSALDVPVGGAGMSNVMADVLRAADTPGWQSPRIARQAEDAVNPERLDHLFAASERSNALRETESREALRDAALYSERRGERRFRNVIRPHIIGSSRDVNDDSPELRWSKRAPRALTWRVVGFVLLVAVLLGGSFGAVVWFQRNSYYVGLDGTLLAIYHGRPGGLAWFEPQLIDKTSVSESQILPSRLSDVREGVVEPSEQTAFSYIHNLLAERSFAEKGGAPGLTSPPVSTPSPAATPLLTSSTTALAPPTSPTTTPPPTSPTGTPEPSTSPVSLPAPPPSTP